MSSKLRVGIVDYLNSRPLARGLLAGEFDDRFESTCHPPARVADLLAAGELDVGLIPSVEVRRIPGLSILPGLCVAATHDVRSVILVARTPIEAVRRVALDLNSRTSACLVEILFRDRWGLEPDYIQAPPMLDEMLGECEAALVIGDPALQVPRERYRVFDLAGEWRRLTGLPFVFAVWAVAPGVDGGAVSDAFGASLERGKCELEEMVAEAVEELGLPDGVLRRYLTENLRFELGVAEVAGLEEFLRRAERHGLIEAAGPLRFCVAEGAAERPSDPVIR